MHKQKLMGGTSLRIRQTNKPRSTSGRYAEGHDGLQHYNKQTTLQAHANKLGNEGKTTVVEVVFVEAEELG